MGLHESMLLLLETFCQMFHESAYVAVNVLSTLIVILVSAVHNMVSPGILEKHELASSLEVKLLLFFPIGTETAIDLSDLRFQSLNYVVPVFVSKWLREEGCHPC